MSFSKIARVFCPVIIVAAPALGLLALAPRAEGQSDLIHDGRVGFVVSDFGYVLAESSPQSAACPQGRTPRYEDLFAATPEGARLPNESDGDYEGRTRREGARLYGRTPDGGTACLNPENGVPVPHTHVTGDVAIDGGIDLDGQISRANGRSAPGTCAHDDFRSVSGARGIDNQFFRLVGCSNGYGPQGSATEFDTEMFTGAWGILISLSGVDDLRNDADVEVHVSANADPIQLSAAREALPNATYAMHQEQRFRSVTRGRIVNGVLTTDTFNFAVPKITSAVFLERSLRDARIRATISADGALEGVLAGYTMIEDMYDFQFGFRRGVDAQGRLTPRRANVSAGSTGSAGMTCQGVYAALHELADGHRDPQTGRCQSISTQYRIRAIPAFVVDVATEGANSDLILQ